MALLTLFHADQSDFEILSVSYVIPKKKLKKKLKIRISEEPYNFKTVEDILFKISEGFHVLCKIYTRFLSFVPQASLQGT